MQTITIKSRSKSIDARKFTADVMPEVLSLMLVDNYTAIVEAIKNGKTVTIKPSDQQVTGTQLGPDIKKTYTLSILEK